MIASGPGLERHACCIRNPRMSGVVASVHLDSKSRTTWLLVNMRWRIAARETWMLRDAGFSWLLEQDQPLNKAALALVLRDVQFTGCPKTWSDSHT